MAELRRQIGEERDSSRSTLAPSRLERRADPLERVGDRAGDGGEGVGGEEQDAPFARRPRLGLRQRPVGEQIERQRQIVGVARQRADHGHRRRVAVGARAA